MMTVYSLTASDEPLQVRYVGATSYPLETRLRGHHNENLRRITRKDNRKSDWIRDVIARGAQVEIRPLSQHQSPDELREAERRWIAFWSRYCELLNLQRYPHRISWRC